MNYIESLVDLASTSTVALVIVILVHVLYGWLGYWAYRILRDIQYTRLASKYYDFEEFEGKEEE